MQRARASGGVGKRLVHGAVQLLSCAGIGVDLGDDRVGHGVEPRQPRRTGARVVLGLWAAAGHGRAIAFDGATGSLGTVGSLAGPSTGFTELAWFETTGSGSIVSFENVYGTAGPANWDRMLWVDSAGQVVAGVYPGSTQEVVSSGSFDNGTWHLAPGTWHLAPGTWQR